MIIYFEPNFHAHGCPIGHEGFFVFISLWLLPASADRIEFCDSISEKLVNWESSVTLPKFDPELGTLKSAELFCKPNLSQEITMENMDLLPAKFNISIIGTLTVELPSQSLSVGFNHSNSGNLSEYDGSEDYSGTSGYSSVMDIPAEARSMSIQDLGDLVAGSAQETIILPVKAAVSFQMEQPIATRANITTLAGAQVCVSYTYDAKSDNEGGE